MIGCEEENPVDYFKEFVLAFNLPSKTTENLDLKDTYEYKGLTIHANWNSDDINTIANDGTVVLSEDDSYVTINVTFSCGSDQINSSFDIIVEGVDIETIINKAFDTIEIPQETSNDIELPDKIYYGSYRFTCIWSSSNTSIISDSGDFYYPDNDTIIQMTCKINRNTKSYTNNFSVLAKAIDENKYTTELSKLSIPTETDTNLSLAKSITIDNKEYSVTWSTSDELTISKEGRISYVSENTTTTLTASIIIKNKTIKYDFDVVVIPNNEILYINQCIDEIVIPKIISNDIILPSSLHNVSLKWKSSDANVIDNSGKINKSNTSYKAVTLQLTLEAGGHKSTTEYNTQVAYEPHMFLDKTFDGTKNNVKVVNGKLVLEDGSLSGTYTTNIIETNDFNECVGSYSAISSKTETCELKVRMRINNKWSKYFSYGEFGLGLQNKCPTGQTDSNSKMSEDEIKVTSGSANAFQLQIIMKRKSKNEDGPIVSLIALTIFFLHDDFNVDISNIRQEVKYDVPKLYQHDVPSIGGIICSVTSSTMLLMYNGYSFDFTSQMPHQYMAPLLKDYGNNVYGNWSYNCIGMGALGFNSYVKRFTSYDEILFHLNYVGPISASIKGTFVNDVRTYTTGGHLIDVIGYKIDGNKIYFYINDPNVAGVYTRTTLENLKAVNRMVSYIVE